MYDIGSCKDVKIFIKMFENSSGNNQNRRRGWKIERKPIFVLVVIKNCF